MAILKILKVPIDHYLNVGNLWYFESLNAKVEKILLWKETDHMNKCGNRSYERKLIILYKLNFIDSLVRIF